MKQHGIVSLENILPGWQPESFSEPVKIAALKPKPPKVIGDPTRTPVNRQAAMIITRAHHLELPPMPPAEPPQSELERLRESNARLTAARDQLLAENKALKKKLEHFQRFNPSKTKQSETIPEIELPKEASSPSKAERKAKILERLCST